MNAAMESRVLAAVPSEGTIGYTALWVAIFGHGLPSAADVGLFSEAIRVLEGNGAIHKRGAAEWARVPTLPGVPV